MKTSGTRMFGFIRAAARIVALLVAATSATNAAAAGSPKSFGKIVVGTGIDVAYGSFFAAVKKGFFQKNGIDAELRIFQSGVEGVEAVVTGQADIGGGGGATLINAAVKGGDVKFIGTYATSDRQTGVVANAAVNGPKGLEGRAVCTQANGDAEYFFLKYVARYKLDRAKITFKDIKYQLLPIALAQGECDVIFSQEPAITRALATAKGSKVLERGGENGIHPLFVHAIVGKKIYSNPEFGAAVVRSMLQAGEWATANPEEMAELMLATTKIPLADARRFVSFFKFGFRFDKTIKDDIINTAKFLLERKIISKPFESERFLEDRFLKAVAPDRL